MKSTGVTRPVDELGRFVIPIEIRRTMEIEEGQPMSIFIKERVAKNAEA